MDFKTFLENFDAIAEAPGGIPKLRSLILDLAVRGKLAPQNPEDEPAQELVIKNKKLIVEATNGKKREVLALQETETALPDGWFRCQLADIALVEMGNSPPGDTYNEDGEGVPLINGPVEFSPGSFGLTVKTKYTTAPSRMCQKGDLLVCVRGATTGRTNIAAFDACIGRGVALIRGWETQSYLNYLLWHLGEQLLQQGKGTTFPSISYSDLAGLEVLLPPLAEQKRIVEKVDELMGLCERYEAAKQTRDNLRQKLRESAISTLMDAETDEKLDAAWAFVRDNWQNLSQQPEDVNNLRQSVLVLAVRGKLVPQNSSDKPASQLLKEIEVDKQRLIKERKIKQCKSLPEIQPEEVLYKLPKGWEWVRLGYVGEFINGDRGKNYPNRNEYVDEGIPWINTGHIEPDGSLTQAEMNFISREKFNSLNNGKIQPGDLVYCLRGATFGKTAIVDPYQEGAIASSLMIIRPFSPCSNRYIYHYLVSPIGRNQIYRFDNGSAQPNLSANSVQLYVFPLPPPAEQKRIVAKVDELMKLCDQLEASLRQSQQRAETLAASAISHLTI